MLEQKYISETPLTHRKDYGQFFTPLPIAHIMAEWIMKDNPESILDPAFGLGIFYEEIVKNCANQKMHFTGYEVDDRILTYSNHKENKLNLTIINGDYLEADPGSFDGIICNPPYMRFQIFLKRHDVLPGIEKKIGKKLVGYANIASIFLIKALTELNTNGRLAFIMPFEFFNTGYGKDVKNTLIEKHLIKQIIIFYNEKDIFPDVTTTVCILLCKKDNNDNAIKISLIRNENEITQITDISNFYQHKISPSNLPYKKKWTPIILSLFDKKIIPSGFCKVSSYGMFMRGIATGANEFFALTKSKLDELKLGDNNLCKCITKSVQIRKSVFTNDDFYSLYNANKPVHCLDVKEHDRTEVIKYIKYGENQGFHNRYLTRNRIPWYKIERRQASPILFGVFSRGRIKVVRNYSSAINFTCFHSFYPNMFGERYIDKMFVYLLSDKGQEILKMNKRSYGDSLDKLEPGDLNDCLCPSQKQFEMIEEWEAENVIEIVKKNEKEAIQISNRLVDRIINAKQDIVPDRYSVALHNDR